MVYCGKPSGGCGTCRTRKIKCDEKRPSCSQCHQARFACPGYRDILTLLFRDQSRDVASRARSSQSRPNRRPDRNHSSLQAQITFTPSVEQFINVFLHHFVLDDSTAKMAYVSQSQLVAHAASSQAVRCALSSLGLAVLSNTNNRPRLMADARREYGSALSLTNLALRDRNHYLRETTLSAIMLLGIFEVIACEAPRSLANWQQHIHGGAALLEKWKPHHTQNLTCIQLYTQLRIDLIANCLRTQTRVPEPVIRLMDSARTFATDARVEADELVYLMTRLCDILADVTSAEVQDTQIISRAWVLDSALENWSRRLSPRWQYDVCQIPHHFGEYSLPSQYGGGCYHRYTDIWACNVWSYYRSARMILNLLIRERLLLCGASLPGHPDPIHAATRNMEQLSMDVFLSVAFTVDFQFPPHCAGPPAVRPGGFLSSYSVLWPLYVAASLQSADSPLREWAARRLEYFGRHMGIGQALVMAAAVRNALPPDKLSVFNYCQFYRPQT